VLTRRDLLDSALALAADEDPLPATVGEAMTRAIVVAHPDDTLRDVAYRMAETGVTRMPVVERGETWRLAGIITLPALLAGRLRDLQEERHSERVLRVAPLRPRRAAEPSLF